MGLSKRASPPLYFLSSRFIAKGNIFHFRRKSRYDQSSKNLGQLGYFSHSASRFAQHSLKVCLALLAPATQSSELTDLTGVCGPTK